MFKQFLDVNDIGQDQPPTTDPTIILILTHLAKMDEEKGEFLKDLNTILGTRSLKPGESMEDIRQNLPREAASIIQCLFLVLQLAGVTYEELVRSFDHENDKYREWVNKMFKSEKKV